MKKYFLSFTFLILSITSSYAQKFSGSVNPATAYCEFLGYKTKIVKDATGAELGVCIFPNGKEVEEFDFFKGKVGEEWSYGSRHGYKVVSKDIEMDGIKYTYAFCILYDSLGNVIEEIPQLLLMKRNKEPLYIDADTDFLERVLSPSDSSKSILDPFTPDFIFQNNLSLPNYFDWRDMNFHSYIGPIRNQGNCMSCYAHSTCAASEGTYNFNNHLFDQNCVDFSEAYIMWCLGTYGPFSHNFDGCEGADHSFSHVSVASSYGLIEESEMPYNNHTDPGSCDYTDYHSTRHYFETWDIINPKDYDAIRTAIFNYGPVTAIMYTDKSSFPYATGPFYIYYQNCLFTTNHAVTIVGWGTDETYGDYWIIRNSYGTSWGTQGYIKIPINCCCISDEVAYIKDVPPIFPPVCGDGICSPGELECIEDCGGGGGGGCDSWEKGFKFTWQNYYPSYDKSDFVTFCSTSDIWMKDKCHLGYWDDTKTRYFRIQEVDDNLTPIGNEYIRKIENDDCHTNYNTLVWGCTLFDVKEEAAKLGLSIQPGHYYLLSPYVHAWNGTFTWKLYFYVELEDFTLKSSYVPFFNANPEEIWAIRNLQTSGSVIIKSNYFMTYSASNIITLNPGFETQSVSNFETQIKQYCINDNVDTYRNDKNEKKSVVEDIDTPTNFQIVPNPFTDFLQINCQLSVGHIGRLVLFNYFGKVVYERVISSNYTSIILPPLSQGIYFFVFYDNEVINGKGKLIHQ